MLASKHLVSALLGVALLLPIPVAPAQAQPTGTRFGRDATPGDANSVFRSLAECVADRRPGLVRRFLTSLPGTAEEAQMLKDEEYELGLCMESRNLVLYGKELVFDARAMRTPLARALVRRALPNARAVLPVPVDSQPWFMARFNALPADADVNRDHIALLDFGHCVATHEWSGTRSFLLAEPATDEERAAIGKLVPVLGPCLTEGMEVQITPTLLRDVLVEPVYQILAASGEDGR